MLFQRLTFGLVLGNTLILIFCGNFPALIWLNVIMQYNIINMKHILLEDCTFYKVDHVLMKENVRDGRSFQATFHNPVMATLFLERSQLIMSM